MEKHTWVLICPQRNLIANQTIDFHGDEHHYAVHVLRLTPGAVVQITNGRGQRAQAQVTIATKKQCTVKVLSLLEDQHTFPGLNIHLWLALPKPTALEIIIPMIAELGCRSLHVFRGEKSLSKQAFLPEKWQRTAWESLRVQHGAWAMNVLWHENGLGPLIETPSERPNTLHLWCDEKQQHLNIPTAIQTLAPKTLFHDETRQDIILLIGPEGSFSPAEVGLIKKSLQPWVPVTLGPRVLKTSTACVAAVATAHTAWQKT